VFSFGMVYETSSYASVPIVTVTKLRLATWAEHVWGKDKGKGLRVAGHEGPEGSSGIPLLLF
jgi:hypothetical protein